MPPATRNEDLFLRDCGRGRKKRLCFIPLPTPTFCFGRGELFTFSYIYIMTTFYGVKAMQMKYVILVVESDNETENEI